VTIIFNCIYCNLKTVKFSKVSWHKTCIRVFLLSACKRVFFFRCFWLLCLDLTIFINNLLRSNVNVNLSGFSREKSLNGVKSWEVLIVHRREGFKFEVSRGGPVETLFRELILVSVSYTKTDIVILFDTLNATPE